MQITMNIDRYFERTEKYKVIKQENFRKISMCIPKNRLKQVYDNPSSKYTLHESVNANLELADTKSHSVKDLPICLSRSIDKSRIVCELGNEKELGHYFPEEYDFVVHQSHVEAEELI